MQKLYKHLIKCCKLLIISSSSFIFIFVSLSIACDINLIKNVEVNSDRVFISDIASKYPKNIEKMPISLAPMPNETTKIDADYLKSILNGNNMHYNICGSYSIVKRKAFLITADTIYKLMDEKDLIIQTKLPIALPYNHYTLSISSIKNYGEYSWIQLTVMLNNQVYRNFFIQYVKKIDSLVPIASQDIRSYQVISKDDIEYKRVDYVPSYVITTKDSIISAKALGNIKAGSFFTFYNTQRQMLVNIGDIVSAMYDKNGIDIQTSAKALQMGYKGDIIKVEFNSKRIGNARVIGLRKVEVIQ
ncbi:flagellar basal body P-ring formation chaperone FlgA [Desulfurella amilsii]|uniref:flagellar basal body P-ring formation chaperone FlgA n=1 Tax=Desulfurella amilsii TaxID=1562698 RepID=UPI0013025FF5|nr:flagellar basal body P-ring formation chaperone FlgA [Desulfurella amilsii]